VELRDTNGATPAIWSDTVNADTLLSGSNWNSFPVTGVTLTKGTTYRIYATRSAAHNLGVDQITWSASDAMGDDEYEAGVSSSASAIMDFMFRTYVDGVLDQEMTVAEYGFSLADSNYSWWQEFVPGA